jgi:hypothetical protein
VAPNEQENTHFPTERRMRIMSIDKTADLVSETVSFIIIGSR